ncbi:hypothetical protein APHAL10511_001852 [Amanita phalloides]|nr:hypothetical protein APHAL10511_001852 [Amanita phalloides]
MPLFTTLIPLAVLAYPLTVLASPWYQDPSSPVHNLFRRGPEEGVTYAPVGSRDWSSGFPGRNYDPSDVPQAWKDALKVAENAGKIPDIPASNNTPGTNPVYPVGFNPTSPQVCSATYKCRHAGDIWDAPNGVFATAFDDGPTLYTPKLVNFLDSHNVTATHFVIGINILGYPEEFLWTLSRGQDLGLHTWTHPYMTTLTNDRLIAEFGWSMLLIRNSTGGLLPKYWRPPFGDCDNRVRAIAKEIFNLTTVVWNKDTRDWSLTSGGTTMKIVEASMKNWTSGPKDPGLIILEHELSNYSVDAFINAFPLIKNNGWHLKSLTRLWSNSPYQEKNGSAAKLFRDPEFPVRNTTAV